MTTKLFSLLQLVGKLRRRTRTSGTLGQLPQTPAPQRETAKGRRGQPHNCPATTLSERLERRETTACLAVPGKPVGRKGGQAADKQLVSRVLRLVEKGHQLQKRKNAGTPCETAGSGVFGVQTKSGEREIRTPGTLRYAGFQDRCNLPSLRGGCYCDPRVVSTTTQPEQTQRRQTGSI